MPLWAISVLLAAVIILRWRKRREQAEFLLFLLAGLIWVVGELLNAMAADAGAARIAKAFSGLGRFSLAPSALLLSLRLSGRRSQLRKWWMIPAFLPAFAALAFFLLDWHLFCEAIVLERGVWVTRYGPLVYLFLAHTNIAAAGAVVVAAGQVLRGQLAQRMRAVSLLAATAAPWTILSLNLGGLLDLPAAAMPLTTAGLALLAWAVDEYFSGIEINPLARDMVIESMPEGMIATGRNGCISDINLAAARLLGVGRSALQKPLGEVLGDWKLDPDGAFPAELEFAGRSVHVSRAGLERGGETIGSVFLFRDVTEERKLQKELREASEAALRAAKVQSDFLANMSHEIRTPLTGILGMSQLLADSGLDDQQREYMGMICDSAETLRVIVNDILDLSKIESGLMKIRREPVDLARLVTDTAALFGEAARDKGIPIAVRVAPGFPPFVKGDATRLRQILANLLSNAVKFTAEGSISVELGLTGDGRYSVAVEDSGVGFQQSEAERLFERFVQADSSTTRRYGGTGLGLSIVRKLVELMKGEIRARSTPGRGSRFEFTLPLKQASASATPVPASASPVPVSRQRLRILVAEDNRVNQRLLSALLGRLGHHVEIAENGEAALERVNTEQWDLVLMDCSMPVMDGYTATERIRQQEREASRGRVPIVAVTASVLDQDRQRCLAAGMDEILAKPIDLSALHRAVSTHCGSAKRTALAASAAAAGTTGP